MHVTARDFGSLVDRDRAVDHLRELVSIPSENPPGEEAKAAEWARSRCEDLGLEVDAYEAEPDRPNLVASWSGGPGPTLCFCSHLDVVPAGDPGLWGDDPYGASVSDGRVLGRGSSDAKGPLVAALEAVEVLMRAEVELAGTLQLALVSDEEAMGFKGAGYLVEKGVLAPDIGVIGEPTSLRVVRAQRGACWFRLVTKGIAGHGSAPERGVNAIRHMAEILIHLEETMPDITHPVLGGPSINIGTIRGGEKVNVIPAACICEVDRRTVPGESEESVLEAVARAIDRARERFPDIDATAEIPFWGKPFETRADSPVVEALSWAAEQAAQRPPELIGFRGASDARFLAEAGADVAVFGPGDITLAHTARESIGIDDYVNGIVAYALAFAKLLSPGGWSRA